MAVPKNYDDVLHDIVVALAKDQTWFHLGTIARRLVLAQGLGKKGQEITSSAKAERIAREWAKREVIAQRLFLDNRGNRNQRYRRITPETIASEAAAKAATERKASVASDLANELNRVYHTNVASIAIDVQSSYIVVTLEVSEAEALVFALSRAAGQ